MSNNLLKLLPIKTDRLILRPLDPSEAKLIVQFLRENREHLAPWEETRPEVYYTADFWKKEINLFREEFFNDKSLPLSLFLRKSPEKPMIGMCHFTSIIRGPFQACYLGYNIDHSYQGRGLMFEALQASIDFVFKHIKLHRIMANYMPINERSGRLLKKLGFVVEGYARDYLNIDGEWRDHIFTSLLNPYE